MLWRWVAVSENKQASSPQRRFEASRSHTRQFVETRILLSAVRLPLRLRTKLQLRQLTS